MRRVRQSKYIYRSKCWTIFPHAYYRNIATFLAKFFCLTFNSAIKQTVFIKHLQINLQRITLFTSYFATIFLSGFLTPCQTPNFEVSLCTEISKCLVLDLVKSKKKYSPFVEASRCGPANEDSTDFKVCCGRYNSFRNVSIAAGKFLQSIIIKYMSDIHTSRSTDCICNCF